MHKAVLLNEVLEALRLQRDGFYVDGTLGAGGHAEKILERLGPRGRLLGLDVDPASLALAKDRLQPFEDQTITRRVNFRGLQGVLHELGWTGVDGMIFDLGVSSAQLADASRGFSFQKSGPLDMRLDPSLERTALSILKALSEETMTYVLRMFGEDRQARRISRYLLHDVASGRIRKSDDLARFCERVIGRRGKIHPATKIFLALRCLVNEELEALEDLLIVAPFLLNVGGRLAIISFHSLEDKIVKERYRDLTKTRVEEKIFSVVTKKPISPSPSEILDNPRSRSAKLRVLERIQ